MERIIEVICGEYGIGPEDLIRTRRGYFNEPRNVAVYLSRVIAGEPLIKIGERFVQLQQRQQYNCQDEKSSAVG